MLRENQAASGKATTMAATPEKSASRPRTGRVEMVEVMKVVESIDKEEACAHADEQRRSPIPGVGVGVGRDWVPQHVTLGALQKLPGPVRLQARASDDLLHRAVDFRLPGDRATIAAVVRWG